LRSRIEHMHAYAVNVWHSHWSGRGACELSLDGDRRGDVSTKGPGMLNRRVTTPLLGGCQPFWDRWFIVSLGRGFLLGFVDPHCVWEWWRCWWFMDEPFGVSVVRGVEDGCALLTDFLCPSVVHVPRCVVSNT
jgi:hypothetical protein